MKIDVLDKLDKIKICVGYKIDGKNYNYFPQGSDLWSKIEPVYEEFEGWQSSTVGITKYSDLPIKAQKYIKKIEDLCEVKVILISTGALRQQTIIL